MGNFKNELHNFQNVPRDLVFDSSLSDRARFVYLFMACKPEGWDFYLEPMAKDIGYSIDTLRKYINELVASGWLIKGEQQNENGKFGAVEYILKATKISDTENFRHGENPTQHKYSLPNNKLSNIDDNKIENNNNKEIKKESDELFEKCWIAYKRKGKKGKAKPYWDKLSQSEKESVLQHIKIYTSTRELQYQQDFERYLKDKTFLSVVVSKNNVVYDPTRLDKKDKANEVYMPLTDGALSWNDYYHKYMYIGNFDGFIPDGYTDENRPDGATIMLNNSRGTLVWSVITKTWNKI